MNQQKNGDINIELLSSIPESINKLSDIWWNIFGKIWMGDSSKEEIAKDLYMQLNIDHLPLTFVALDNDQPVGMCSLLENDGIWPDFIYKNLSLEESRKIGWLADLVVSPEYQNKGIGSMLIFSIIKKAKELNLKKLYLYVFEPSLVKYYLKLGWKISEIQNLNSHSISIMNLEL